MKQLNKKILIFIIPLVIFLLLIIMLFTRLGKPADIVTSRTIGQPLPEFSLPLLSDINHKMNRNDLPKQPFLLNVWGSWCQTCWVEHPFLIQLQKQGVLMVGVNYKDHLPDALAYLNQNQDPFLYSIQDLQGSYALDLGLMGAPESFVVGGDGIVYQHIVGEIHEKNWQSQIEPCLQALSDQSLDQSDKLKACQ